MRTQLKLEGSGIALIAVASLLIPLDFYAFYISGSLRPRRADGQLTAKIKSAASLLAITVLDHIIVSEEGYYSFADEGLI